MIKAGEVVAKGGGGRRVQTYLQGLVDVNEKRCIAKETIKK